MISFPQGTVTHNNNNIALHGTLQAHTAYIQFSEKIAFSSSFIPFSCHHLRRAVWESSVHVFHLQMLQLRCRSNSSHLQTSFIFFDVTWENCVKSKRFLLLLSRPVVSMSIVFERKQHSHASWASSLRARARKVKLWHSKRKSAVCSSSLGDEN